MRQLIKDFLLFCSGVNFKILRRKPCQQDCDKHLVMGTAVFFTAICATLSGGYAFYTIFHDQILATAFGLFWGANILTLNRLLVIFSEKQNTFQWKTLVGYAARMLMAILFALVIATPLELRIFQDAINVQIDQAQITESITYEKSLPENTTIADLQIRRVEVKQQIGDRQAKLDAGRLKYQELLAQYGQSSTLSIAVDKQNQEMQRELRVLTDQEAALLGEIYNLEAQKGERVAAFATTQHRNRSLVAQLTAFEAIKQENFAIDLASHIIRYVCMMTDILPILIKMVSSFSVYDAALFHEKNKGLHDLQLQADQDYEAMKWESMMISEMASESRMAAKKTDEWETNVTTISKDYAKATGDHLNHKSTTQTPYPNVGNFTDVTRRRPKTQPKRHHNNVITAFNNGDRTPKTNEHL